MDEFQEDTQSSNESASPTFVMNQELASSYLENLDKYPKNKRICICGHPVNSHHFDTKSGYSCTPGNIWCRCARPEPVYCASDARFFLRSTSGFGFRHALAMGIAALTKKGGNGQWMVNLFCEINGCKELEITVACLTEDNRVTAKSTKYSRFLCHKHCWELGGWML